MTTTQDHGTVARKLGFAARYVREKFRLSLEDAAMELNFMYLEEFERGEFGGDIELAIDRFRNTWQIDLMQLAAVLCVDIERLPAGCRYSANKLLQSWEEAIERLIKERNEF